MIFFYLIPFPHSRFFTFLREVKNLNVSPPSTCLTIFAAKSFFLNFTIKLLDYLLSKMTELIICFSLNYDGTIEKSSSKYLYLA